MNIIKRDGTIVKFEKNKIKDAIVNSMKYGSGIINERSGNGSSQSGSIFEN